MSQPTPDERAADWLIRRDRGLTPGEQDDYLQWLAADPRHGDAFARQHREQCGGLAGDQAVDEELRLVGGQAEVLGPGFARPQRYECQYDPIPFQSRNHRLDDFLRPLVPFDYGSLGVQRSLKG